MGMISCEFKTAQEAIRYAQSHGGWLFYRLEDGHTFWHCPRTYTMHEILRKHAGSGYCSAWVDMERYVNELEAKLV